MNSFEEIKIGDTAEILHEITEDDVKRFSDLTGDTNPLHIDETFAATTTFKKRIVHGMLAASFVSTIIGTKLPGHGSLWMSQNLRFLRPIRIGDTIHIVAKVTHKSISQRVLTLETIIFNEYNQKVIEGEAKVKVLKKTKENIEMNNTKHGAIVTGASRGIGAAIAVKLAKDGFGILINYRESKEEAESVLKKIIENGGKAYIFQADVRDQNKIEEMVRYALEKFSKIDLLVNNATSSVLTKSFEELLWTDIQEHIDVQLKGAFNTCKTVIPHFVANKRGKIINIGSIFIDNVPPSKLYGYVVVKTALSSFTKSLALEYGPKGLNINMVSPGMTETALIADLPEKVKMITEMQTPLRRLAKPEDIANVVSFLASDSANYLTGETIRVCGGQIMI